MSWFNAIVLTVLGLVIALFIFAIFGIFSYVDDCENRGGHLVGDGTYTTTYIQSGNVLIPLTNENMVCSK